MVKVIPKPARNRDLVMRNVWKKLDDGSYAFVITPESHAEYPENAGDFVRALYPTTIRLTSLREAETRIDYLMQLKQENLLRLRLKSLRLLKDPLVCT